jgi:hypothetical protein
VENAAAGGGRGGEGHSDDNSIETTIATVAVPRGGEGEGGRERGGKVPKVS